MLFDNRRQALHRALAGALAGVAAHLLLGCLLGAPFPFVSPGFPGIVFPNCNFCFTPEWLGVLVSFALFALFGAEIGIATLPFAGTGQALVKRTMIHFLAMAATLALWVGLNAGPEGMPLVLVLLAVFYVLIWLGRWIGWYLEVAAIREKLGLAPGPSPLKWRETLPYLAFALLLCLGVPVVLSVFDAVDVPVLRALYFPYLVLPVGSFVSALSLWKRQGICPLYPVGCALFTLAAVVLVYNSSALFFCGVAFGSALAGGLLGLLLRRRKAV
ncbi:hypothetical protein B5G43_15085 [Flavonifractor sp. An92]|uniref:DUF3021 family protein n=1 Tax=Flavonifractor sp. An92 TaxID=1965666 RepID=UPI000B39DA19|nr:DUF3021 family protein [Flavonifractor sp. An92]OUN03690.1 hypothetical protein B5G43_15085 [Flavonifractor sp. An92]